ncbi:phenylalanine--tRNA ligase subunit beta [Methanothermococcus okinawensis]|uniref:Phenylalanine--tRNA ligase beta subunit n=1 Tax=Methanothermococcus okinawensis (strain DSM 14208 / JCM 11175 / IH1) TaxID=647113 RepID=F8AL83_METOI|nr:phenylalanine--tRNA ligase subunit beta [Methanothermococcus okinawensis]AEH06634.1 Phenylalanyl-tRNA synthetase beta chain [Methanothermococcus okinawensis IH1]
MPTINVYKRDLENLVNMSLSDKTIEDKFPMMGVEVEEIFEEIKNNKKEKIIQFSVNPDRPDYLSVEGLARGFRGFIGIDKGIPKYEVKESNVEVYVEDVELRPYCAFAIVRNVIVDDMVLDSIINLQEKLHWTIGRDRKKIAIGIHDFDKVNPPFCYKEIGGNELKFEPLGYDVEMTPEEILQKHEKGIKYAHLITNNRYPIILDKDGNVLSMPPIINGNLTKITTNTRNLLIDITGTDKNAVENTLNILVSAFADRGGTIYKVIVKDKKDIKIYPDLTPKTDEVDLEFINKRLGLDLNPGEVINALRKARMDAEYNYEKNNIIVKIPAYRVDILHKVDFTEEVAIHYGYDKFTGKFPHVATIGEKHTLEKKFDFIRNIMIGYGFFEVMNLTLSNQEVLFKKMKIDMDDNKYVEVLKPASLEHRVVRPSILPLLLETLYTNKHNELPQKIFEVGDCVVIDENDKHLYTKCKNVGKVAFAIIHPNANFNELKSYAEGLLREIDIDYTLENYHHPSFIDGRCAKIISNEGKTIGYFGELHPEVILNFDLEYPIVGFEMEL